MTQTLTDMKIEKIRLALYNEGTFYKENISVYVSELQFKINEIIDKLNSKEERIGK